MLLILFLTSCSLVNDEVFQRIESDSISTTFGKCFDSRISLSDVRAYVEENSHSDDVKSSFSASITPIVSSVDTVMYIVNYQKGWEVLSADRRMGPIIMRCDSGSITEDLLYSNPAISFCLDDIKESLDSLRKHPVLMTEQVTRSNPTPPLSFYDENGTYWVFAYKYRVFSIHHKQDPLMGLKWGQGTRYHQLYPERKWNINAPFRSSNQYAHCVMGCSPVAYAQILYYLHDKNGVPAYFYKDANCTAVVDTSISPYVVVNDTNTSFSSYGNYWSLMPIDGISATDEGFSAVSSFMLDIGKQLNAKYYQDITEPDLLAFESTFNHYGYDCSFSTSFSESVVRDQVYVNKLPILVNISGIRDYSNPNMTDEPINHTVVIDGYDKLTERYTYVYQNGDSGSFIYTPLSFTFEYEYFSCNWGYDGSGQYDANGDVIWCNLADYFYRTFSNGHDSATMYGMYYDFTEI